MVGAALATTYCASKGGVLLLTKALALELRPLNIRVNALCPALTDTRLGQQVVRDYEGYGAAQMMVQITSSQGRVGAPEEVANAALFLASDEAAFITGHGLSVDGGAVAG